MATKKKTALAKLTRPRLYAAVKRTRLFKLLDQSKSNHAIWVSGPPGAGKTTLVASYLEARKAKTFWYQVDEGDRDPASLFYYLAELGYQSASRKHAVLPFLTPEYLPDLAGFARRFFRQMFLRLGAGSILVFDNCQDAAADAFNVILREACEEIPPDSQFILLSRTAPPVELSRQITNRRLQLIAWPDLRLTDREAMAIIAASAKLPANQAVTLNRQCDGWVGGLVLLLARNDQCHGNKETRAFESKQALFGYFAEEVLSRAAPDTRDLLLRTALFPHTTLSMASQIKEGVSPGPILDTLYRSQYFIDRKVEGELTYQYHDLFREFLLVRLAEEHEPAQLAALRRRAAEILEHRGWMTEAVELFKQAQDWPNVARLIRTHAEALLAQGRWQTLSVWFEGLPLQVIIEDPWLMLWQASAQIPVDAAAAYQSTRNAYEAFVTTHDDDGQFHALGSATLLVYTVGASFVVFDEWFPRLEQQLARRTENLSTEAGAQALAAYLSMVTIRTGRGNLVEWGEHWLARLYLSNELGQGLGLLVGDQLLHMAIWPARLDFGESVYRKLERLAEHDDSPPESRYHATKDLGYWHYFNAEYAQSLVFFDRAVQQATQFGMHAQCTYAKCFRLMALCGLGDVQGAAATLREVSAEPFGGNVFSNSAVNWASSMLHATRGNYSAAFDRAREAAAHARAAGFTLLEILTELPEAVYAVELNRIDAATTIVRHIRELASDTIWRFPHCLLSAIEVEIYLRQGDRSLALAALRETLRLADNPRMAAFLAWAKHWLPRHFAFAFDEQIEVSTVQQLIRRFNVAPDDVSTENWPWPVKIRTLGTFEIQIEGEPVTFGAKAPKKTLALLKVMIALGGRAVKEEELVDALWPDSEGDAGHEALKITLLRLRKLLGSPDTIEFQQQRLSLNAKRVWVDAFAFESSADRDLADAVPQHRSGALRLYRGKFLSGEAEQAWPVLARERLQRKFVQLVARHAKALEQSGEHDAAEQAYLRGLDADNLIEQFYQGLMRCNLARGRSAEGMDVYRRMRELLSITLNVAPSQASQALFKTLQHSSSAAAARPS